MLTDGYGRELRTLTEQAGLTRCVHYVGHRSDVLALLKQMNVFVHPGHPEPFGLVNIEAMACGLPIVSFAHGALPEIVTAETGILVEPMDTVALGHAVSYLLSNRDVAEAMGQAGKIRAETQFNISRTVAEIEALYERYI